jgi:Transglutaminase-like superfamily
MAFLRVKAFWNLAVFDWYVARGDFGALYARVRNCPIARVKPGPDVLDRVCSAVDMACVWYWKQVLCLQRSAATTCLLRSHGIAAEMVIGAQQLPFRAHAWVEAEGRVVNDKLYTPELYAVIDRC